MSPACSELLSKLAGIYQIAVVSYGNSPVFVFDQQRLGCSRCTTGLLSDI